jgi:hypothetical protein
MVMSVPWTVRTGLLQQNTSQCRIPHEFGQHLPHPDALIPGFLRGGRVGAIEMQKK